MSTTIFEPVSCFSDNTKSNGYCTGNIVILLASCTSAVASSLLLVWHMNAFGWFQKETFKKFTTWIFMMMLIFTVITTVRYTIYFNKGYSLLLLLNQFV